MVAPVTFEVRAHNSNPQFSIPADVRDALELPRKDAGDGSALYLTVWDAASGEQLWPGEKELRSGQEVYGRRDRNDIGYAIRRGQQL